MNADEFYNQGVAIRKSLNNILGMFFDDPTQQEKKDPTPPTVPGDPQQQPYAPATVPQPAVPSGAAAPSVGTPPAQPAGSQAQASPTSPSQSQPFPQHYYPPSAAQAAPPANSASPQGPQQSPAGGQPSKGEFRYDTAKAKQIIDFYVSKGYDPRFAVGMAANAYAESTFRTDAWNDKEDAFGIFQWRNDRQDNMREFARQQGLSLDDLNAHLAFSLQEMTAAERRIYNQITGQDPQSAEDYARLIDRYYEQSKGLHTERRARIAKQMWEQFYGGAGEPAAPENYETQTSIVSPDDAAAVYTQKGQVMSGHVTQSPTGGVPQVDPTYAPGKQREGLGGLADIFIRREGEGDESFRSRRKGLFLAAAEGFQMLSRGEHADFGKAAAQGYTQSNKDRDTNLANKQENRLQRAQSMDEAKFNFQRASYVADKAADADMRKAIGKAAIDMGHPELAQLAENGGAELASTLLTNYAKPKTAGELPFTLSPDAAESAATFAEKNNLGHLAPAIRNYATNPDAAKVAYKQVAEAELVSAAPEDRKKRLYDMIPAGASPAQRQQAQAYADILAPLSNDDFAKLADNYGDVINKIREEGSAIDKVANSIIDEDTKEYNRRVGTAGPVLRAALIASDIASNANFDSGTLRESFLAPVARVIRDLPGGEEFNKIFLDIDSEDLAGYRLLEALRNGRLGDLGQGVNGQLSNLEGERLLSSLASGDMTRVEIMALGQLLRSSYQAMFQDEVNRQEYIKATQDADPAKRKEWNMTDYLASKDSASTEANWITRISGETDQEAEANRLTMAEQILNDAGVSDPRELPADKRGLVVSVYRNGGVELVPLFAELYPEYQGR